MAEPIEMPFGLRTRVGLWKHVLDGGPDPPWGGENFWGGEWASHCKVICAKMAERIWMPFGLWVPILLRNHNL